jgi:hypothetical protein
MSYTLGYKIGDEYRKDVPVPMNWDNPYAYAQFLENFSHASEIVISYRGKEVDRYEKGRSLRNFP